METHLANSHFDEAALAERLELFRYTDLSQPLIQTLFTFQLPELASQTDE